MRAPRSKLVGFADQRLLRYAAPSPNWLTDRFLADRVVAERSMLIKNLIDDLGEETLATESIPIPNVNDPVLRKVIEWCEHHRNDATTSADDDNDTRKKTTDIDEWDQKFMQVDQEMLFEIILVRHTLPCLVSQRPRFANHHLAGCQLP